MKKVVMELRRKVVVVVENIMEVVMDAEITSWSDKSGEVSEGVKGLQGGCWRRM